MDKTILIVEDEFRMREIISDYLKQEGYMVLEADNGMDALEVFENNKIDLILLDIMLPRLDGFTVCRSIRKKDCRVFIIMLTAKSEEYDKLMGYEFGADDYISKPFSLKVLIAKVNALLKRTQMDSEAAGGIYEAGGIIVNEISHNVTLNGEELEFTPKEFDLLIFLIRNKNIVLSREVILNKVWGYNYYGDLRTVDTHIKRIRQKLKHEADMVSTIRGSGYKFEVKK